MIPQTLIPVKRTSVPRSFLYARGEKGPYRKGLGTNLCQALSSHFTKDDRGILYPLGICRGILNSPVQDSLVNRVRGYNIRVVNQVSRNIFTSESCTVQYSLRNLVWRYRIHHDTGSHSCLGTSDWGSHTTGVIRSHDNGTWVRGFNPSSLSG